MLILANDVKNAAVAIVSDQGTAVVTSNAVWGDLPQMIAKSL